MSKREMMGFIFKWRKALGPLVSTALVVLCAAAPVPKGEPSVSYLESIFGEQGQTIPADFDQLTEKLTGGAPVHEFARFPGPHNRSLAGGCVDATSPRKVRFVPGKSEGGLGTFLGFSEKCNEVESISWNPTKKQFDFILIKNFGAGRKPTVVHPQRELCLSCHQHGGPIFPTFPWSETDARLDGSITNLMGPPQKGAPELARGATAKNPALDRAVGDLDTIVRSANISLQGISMCNDLCGTDHMCRRFLAGLAVLSHTQLVAMGGVDQTPARIPSLPKSLMGELISAQILGLQEFTKNYAKIWPKDGFAYPSSVLPDRDPLSNEEKGGTTRLFENATVLGLFGGSFDAGEVGRAYGIQTTSAQLPYEDVFVDRAGLSVRNIVGLPTGQNPGNPALPRPKIDAKRIDAFSFKVESSSAFTGVASIFPDPLEACFGFASNNDTLKLDSKNMSRLLAIFNTPDQNIDVLMNQWPPKAESLVAGFQKLIDSNETIPTCAMPPDDPLGNKARDVIDSGKEAAAHIEIVPAVHTSPKELFSTYCASCHNGMYRRVPQLPIGDQGKLRKYRADDGTSVFERLRDHIMPPDIAPQPTADERDTMMDFVK